MYLDHFGLSEAPFRITPHTEFFFAGANRGATLDALIYAIMNDEGIVKVDGEVGSGKTMLCRVLMEKLPAKVVIVYLANPSLSRDDIVFAIGEELGLVFPENSRVSAAIRALQERLIELHGEGHRVVVLIDEAHAMPAETLEEIRLLSNLETSRHKLLQLVLFGQPELDAILARPDMRQLRERITHHFTLEPLRRDDVVRYIDFRMRAAGYRGPPPFTDNAVKLVADASQGLTRRINILAEKSLLAAYAEGLHQITPKHVHAAVRDSRYEEPGRMKRHRVAVMFGTVGGVALMAAALSAVMPRHPVAPPPEPPARETAPAAAAAPSAPAESHPEPQAAPPSPSPARSESTPPAQATPTTPPAPSSVTLAPSPPSTPSALAPSIQQRLEESRRWIAKTPGDRWFIQLVGMDIGQADYAQQFLSRADKLLHPETPRLYVASNGSGQRLGIVSGEFPSRSAANEAIARLPAELRIHNPYPRQVSWLK